MTRLYIFHIAWVSGMRDQMGSYECAFNALQKIPVDILNITCKGTIQDYTSNPLLGQYCTPMPSGRG